MDESEPAGHGRYVVADSPYALARWRPLVHWALAIPHLIIAGALQYVRTVVLVIYWFVVLFTAKPNRGLYGIAVLYERYNTRAAAFLFGFSERYPPFDFSTASADNGTYPPIQVQLPQPPDTVPRKRLANVVLAIPHYLMIALYAIAAVVVLVLGWFAVVVTGAWPRGMRDFLVRFGNYYYRVWAYVAMVEEDYPSFGLPA